MSAGGALGVRSLPESRVPDPREAPAIRWGILGPGFIANEFAMAVEPPVPCAPKARFA